MPDFRFLARTPHVGLAIGREPVGFLKHWTEFVRDGYTTCRLQTGDERYMIAGRYKTAPSSWDRPVQAPDDIFRYARVEEPEALPVADERIVDVALLDLNCGWPNLGHDALVHSILETACHLLPALRETGLTVRAVSFAVRDHRMLPEPPGGRFAVYLGTGGPGHIDPHENDGHSPGSQGVREDPAWERPAFDLFDAIRKDQDAALLAVCHTFGVLCRWAGVARPVLRSEAKGKSSGVLENVLTPEGRDHPWFSRLASVLADGRHLRIVDSRLYDLIPGPIAFTPGFIPIGFETGPDGWSRGEAMTMMELARDRGGVMPRIFGVNHHPEIGDRNRQHMLLNQKWERGEVTREWFEERLEMITRTYPGEDSDELLHRTSVFTLLGPLRFHIARQVRLRAEALGLRADFHEDEVLDEEWG